MLFEIKLKYEMRNFACSILSYPLEFISSLICKYVTLQAYTCLVLKKRVPLVNIWVCR